VDAGAGQAVEVAGSESGGSGGSGGRESGSSVGAELFGGRVCQLPAEVAIARGGRTCRTSVCMRACWIMVLSSHIVQWKHEKII